MTTSKAAKHVRTSHREMRERSRRRILTAARILITDQGIDAFTMRVLAERANVSMQTIYSAFGTKERILQALMAQGQERIEQDLRGLSSDEPIEILCATTELLISSSIQGRRPLIAAAFEHPDMFHYEGTTWWHTRGPMTKEISKAIDQGLLKDILPAEELSEHCRGALMHHIRRWARNQLTDDELRRESSNALALTLLACATAQSRPRLLRLVALKQER